MNTAKSLRIALAMNEMKQRDLAKKLNCTEKHVSNMKLHGIKSTEKLSKISQIFGMQVSEFIKLGEQ